MLVAFAGCAPGGPPATVIYASGADLQSINPLVTVHPLARQVQKHVLFTTLARYDSALVARPYLADWSWSSDRRSLTFELREGVNWHDGSPTTSADVAFTLDAARDPATVYPRAAELACLVRVAVTGPRTVRLDFCRPQERLPDVLTDLAILPAHLLRDVPRALMRTAAFNAHPVGNGPFRFRSRRPGRRWVFEANRSFSEQLGGPPRIERLVIVVVDEPTTKLAALVSGELDFAGIAPLHAGILAKVPGRRVLDYPLLYTYGLFWNTRRPPFDDPALRRALTMAMDRERLVQAHVFGFGRPAHGPVPPEHPGAVAVEPIPFDREAAERALDSLGWFRGSDGVRARGAHRLSFDLLTVGSADNVLEQLIQSDLARVGVELRIRQRELGAFLATVHGAERDYDAVVTGVSGDLEMGWLQALFDSRRRSGPLQYAQYSNPELDRALDARDFAAVQRIVAREVPVTFLYHGRGVQGVRDRVEGVRMDLRGELVSVAQWRVRPELR